MTWTKVASVVATPGINGGTTSAINTTGATLLAVAFFQYDNAAITVSDSKGNTWTGLTHYTGSGQSSLRIFYSIPTSVGSGHTFTASASASFPAVVAVAFSGSVPTFDIATGTASASTSSTRQPGSVTPARDGSLILTGVVDASSGLATIDSGFTMVEQSAYNGGISMGGSLAWLDQTTAAAINPTWTLASSSQNRAAIAVFNPQPVSGAFFGFI